MDIVKQVLKVVQPQVAPSAKADSPESNLLSQLIALMGTKIASLESEPTADASSDGVHVIQQIFDQAEERGELITKPIRFNGNRLLLNLATSVVGSVRVEIQDPQAEPIPGFTLGDSEAIYGDEIARPATWRGNPDVSALAGKAVRLRFELKDADLYAYQFKWIQTR